MQRKNVRAVIKIIKVVMILETQRERMVIGGKEKENN